MNLPSSWRTIELFAAPYRRALVVAALAAMLVAPGEPAWPDVAPPAIHPLRVLAGRQALDDTVIWRLGLARPLEAEPVHRRANKPSRSPLTNETLEYTLPVARAWVTPSLLSRPHHDYPAWDLGLPTGTDVFAVRGGTVDDMTASGNCGTGLVIEGDDGYRYTYCHASTLLLVTGDRVTTGQRIALSGATGHSTAPHLHLQISSPYDGLVCPQPLLMAIYQSADMGPADLPSTGCFYDAPVGGAVGTDLDGLLEPGGGDSGQVRKQAGQKDAPAEGAGDPHAPTLAPGPWPSVEPDPGSAQHGG
jgi:Peptidase family M23